MVTIETIFSALDNPDLQNALGTISSAGHIFESAPALGAELRLLSDDNPQEGEFVGTVLFSPNIPRPLHTSFDPKSPNLQFQTDDWFDKLVYVAHTKEQKPPGIFKAFAFVGQVMHKTIDGDPSCGCGSCGDRTRVTALTLAVEQGALVAHYKDLGSGAGFFVLAANFVPDAEGKPTMLAQTYFIADKFSLIKNHRQHAESMRVSEIRRPADCGGRRERVKKHVERLKTATVIFNHPRD